MQLRYNYFLFFSLCLVQTVFLISSQKSFGQQLFEESQKQQKPSAAPTIAEMFKVVTPDQIVQEIANMMDNFLFRPENTYLEVSNTLEKMRMAVDNLEEDIVWYYRQFSVFLSSPHPAQGNRGELGFALRQYNKQNNLDSLLLSFTQSINKLNYRNPNTNFNKNITAINQIRDILNSFEEAILYFYRNNESSLASQYFGQVVMKDIKRKMIEKN